ncbi:CPCC family cysteine-rich protein [Xenorhabdus sp. XENO-10]|uniref:CPCC family cysteine-rich protein n=1 Tax=Xenorhabdus yunnanensis TaxID=3025878 RepID=A0ABT5LEC1_9GAMM|nr:CPCC family cysteine-rich protein [Xenorhabdus yunnanensis]MDC9588254.1 CPCC family cysteine-rich protein [Xenorhabdus yunnanensis]
MELKYPYPCCNNTPFEFIGEYNICPICKWEDDPIQAQDADCSGEANSMSLNEAKKAFKQGRKIE